VAVPHWWGTKLACGVEQPNQLGSGTWYVLVPISRNPRIFVEINKTTTRKPVYVLVHVEKRVICVLIKEKGDYDNRNP
jgi:hypothetical protein